ncbi:hypothetical protein C8Q80DRAFT_1328262 [Daedaleopsis nitida]|nr:hypothetical protein C8Q80DRAFT_1328262 [Daedaleopsis nitida]
MAEDLRPNKRSRTSDEEQGSNVDAPTQLKRHDEFWLNDGNIVLIARDTAFRVYRGLLASQSSVFEDILASSTPIADEVFDGCPAVRLSDSPVDVSHLLRFLLPAKQRTLYHQEKPLPFDLLFSAVTLAHKYHIEDVERQALELIKDGLSFKFRQRTLVRYQPQQAIGAVNLARLTNTPSILPTALYECCGLRGAILDGWKREDGSVEFLSQGDLRRCINGRDSLSCINFQLIHEVFHPMPSEDCTSHRVCEVGLGLVLRDATTAGGSDDYSVLSTWEEVIRDSVRKHDVCAECLSRLLERDISERRFRWMRLPVMFNVQITGLA